MKLTDYRCEACGKSWSNVIPPVRHQCHARGLGDRIASLTKAVGLEPCRPCQQRQKALNQRFPAVQPPQIITLDKLTWMANNIARELRPRSHFVAIPRSGMLPASIMATLTHGQLWQAGSDGVEAVGSGLRFERLENQSAQVYVVDDSIWSGTAMEKAVQSVRRRWPKAEIVRIALISHSSAVRKVERFHSVYDHHFFQWNYANGPFSHHIAWDMDGVLCDDFTKDEVASEARYLKALKRMPTTAMRPVKHPLTIITARSEKYRVETMKWLERSGYQVENLIMAPWTAIDGHELNQVARWKAQQFNRLLDDKRIYVESHAGLAHGIFDNIQRGTVLCTETSEVLVKP